MGDTNTSSCSKSRDVNLLGAKEVLPRLLNILRQTTRRKVNYNAARFPASYHTWVFSSDDVGENVLKGERNPVERLKALEKVVGYDFFKDKVVLDIGSNQGGILMPIADRIACGVGLDINSDLVNCSNRMAVHFQKRNLSFYTYNIDEDMPPPDGASTITNNSVVAAATNSGFDRMLHFLPYNQPDIIFLLAVCQWVKKWKELLMWCSKTAPYLPVL